MRVIGFGLAQAAWGISQAAWGTYIYMALFWPSCIVSPRSILDKCVDDIDRLVVAM